VKNRGQVLDTSKLNTRLTLLTNVAVVAGIIFLAVEIQQNNNLAKAQSIRELYQQWQTINQFEYENDARDLLRKSIEQPRDLTDIELLRLTNYYDMIMAAQLSQATMELEFGLAGSAIDEAPDLVEWYFGSPFARAWFYENQDYLGQVPAYKEALARAIENSPVKTKDDRLDAIKERIQELVN
jgi:hypothetical protein